MPCEIILLKCCGARFACFKNIPSFSALMCTSAQRWAVDKRPLFSAVRRPLTYEQPIIDTL
ncbi:hypothetical protein HMPREF3192_00186 [Atopobium deltae]|uniref:Uncharacterized protein n=1 Tax=Atopobium deltae TaxID=1393034 RepID=A0A133XX63_9ACTN|nr:hypothetical protein HMPREF3192_00186 [Atopobium deltae]